MKKIWIFLFLPFLVFAEIGTVTSTYSLDIDQPFGMALDKDVLLIADRASGRLFQFSLQKKMIVGSTPLPCSHPWGIACDSQGLWISDRENSRILHYQLQNGKVDKVLAEVETDASGLAWDGECLWATSGNTFIKLDPSDGTELQTFEGPGRDSTGIFFDGTYLWISERYSDRIACATAEGTLFGFLPSPGPYPAGIYRKGDTLWILDFEKKILYSTDIGFNSQPFFLGEAKRRKVHFTHSLVNRGPSEEVNARIYVCAGEEDLHQKILKPIAFLPGSVGFIQDGWGQKFAFLEGKILPFQSLELGFEVEVETRDLNYFIIPEWVESLDKIPMDIRKKYLADGNKLKIHDPFIQELTKKLVGGEKNPFWIAFKIHKYLNENMEYKMTGGWNAAPTILKRGNGSCSEFTFSFIALARAAGLPARYEAGLVVRGDDGSMDRAFHRWIQVYLPPFGWIPLDPSRGKPTNAMDVAQGFGSLSNRFFITTHSGGDSPYLGWTYNYNSFYEFSGKAVVDSRSEAKWYPLPDIN